MFLHPKIKGICIFLPAKHCSKRKPGLNCLGFAFILYFAPKSKKLSI